MKLLILAFGLLTVARLHADCETDYQSCLLKEESLECDAKKYMCENPSKKQGIEAGQDESSTAAPFEVK